MGILLAWFLVCPAGGEVISGGDTELVDGVSELVDGVSELVDDVLAGGVHVSAG